MPQLKMGFNLTKEKIIIKQTCSEKEIGLMQKHSRYKAVDVWGVKKENLDFLVCLKNLEQLNLYGTKINDYTALHKFHHLKRLFLHTIHYYHNLSFLQSISSLEQLDLLYLSQLKKFPDLSKNQKLASVMILKCNRLTDISNLGSIPHLKELNIMVTTQQPTDLIFLLKHKHLKYFNAQFSTNKKNKEFDDLLAQYNKTRFRSL